MSREFYATMDAYHRDLAIEFAAEADGEQHVECRVANGQIYVYLHVDGQHVQTQQVPVPDRWLSRRPVESTVRRYVHRYATIGRARITSLDA